MDFTEKLEYCESSPSFLIWISGRRTGLPAGCLQTDKRNGRQIYRVCVNRKLFLAHRIIYQLVNKVVLKDSEEIDHIDGNSLNNHIDNLRAVDRSVNNRNSSKRCTNKSGTTGVYYDEHLDGYKAMIGGANLRKSKFFSCNKYGKELAFELALAERDRLLLDESHSDYTERHGR